MRKPTLTDMVVEYLEEIPDRYHYPIEVGCECGLDTHQAYGALIRAHVAGRVKMARDYRGDPKFRALP